LHENFAISHYNTVYKTQYLMSEVNYNKCVHKYLIYKLLEENVMKKKPKSWNILLLQNNTISTEIKSFETYNKSAISKLVFYLNEFDNY